MLSAEPPRAQNGIVTWCLRPGALKSLFGVAMAAIAVAGLAAPVHSWALDSAPDAFARLCGAVIANLTSLFSQATHSAVVLGLAATAVLTAAFGALAGLGRRRLFVQASLMAPLRPRCVEVDAPAAREAILKLAASLRPKLEAAEPNMVAFLNKLLHSAIELGASDVHFQPLETGTHVCFRVGGVLETSW